MHITPAVYFDRSVFKFRPGDGGVKWLFSVPSCSSRV